MDFSRSIRGMIALVGVIGIALWLGVSLATRQTETLFQFIGVSFLLLCLFMGRRIWLLMIFLSAINVPLIRGFSTLEAGQMAFIGMSILLFLMRKLNIRISFGEPEFWLLMVTACLIQAYLRNPVGLNMFGASSVGARPYFFAGLAFLTGWLLSILKVSPIELRWGMRLTILGTFLGLPIGEYRNARGLEAMGESGDGNGGRFPWLSSGGQMLGRVLVSRMSPFQALGRPLYLFGFLACVLIAASSGYRNAVAYIGLLFAFGIYYHHGHAATMASLFAGAVLIALLSGINLVTPLPGTVQRALSAFPGSWDEQIVQSGTNSTEWRVEMWKEALFTENWIKNKILGDGLGMSRLEMDRMMALNDGGPIAESSSGLSLQQENLMLTGGYHSGPVHSVRTVGYVGLVVIIAALVRMAVLAHRQIIRCRNTEWFGLALFFCLPILIVPVFWTFIFGEFHSAFSGVAMAVGVIRLLENNIPLPAWKRPSRVPYLLNTRRPSQMEKV